MRAERKPLSGDVRRVGSSEFITAAVGDTTIMRERMLPGWRWAVDMKPVVGTESCQAMHQLFVVSGRLHVVMDDGAELEIAEGDAAVVPPGHDAWVVGDEPCEIIDFSPTYVHLIAAGEAYQHLAASAGPGRAATRSRVATKLRAEAQSGRLDPNAVELVLGAVAGKPGRRSGPAGLTPRELEVLALIATGASAKQVAHALGIAVKTANTHIERIYIKCGVSSRSGVTHFAIAHGLVQPIKPGS